MSDINSQDENGLTALHRAVIRSDFVSCTTLLAQGADPNIKDIGGTTPLHYAVLRRKCFIISKLLENNADINIGDSKYQTPLHIACLYKCLKVVNKLLKKGAELEKRDILYQTSLHHAAQSGAWQEVNALIKKGAQVNAMNIAGQTPLHLAVDAYKNSINCKNVNLTKTYIGKTIDSLIKGGADLNIPDMMGDTVLHHSVATSSLKLVDMCIANGASVNSSNQKGKTALHIAAALSDWRQFEQLLSLNGDPFMRDNDGLTALYVILWNHLDCYCENEYGNSFNISNKFVKLEAIINKHNSSGLTALHYSISLGLVNTVQLLLRAGADPESRDEHGQTALHLAILTGGHALDILLEHGVNVNAKRCNDDTALHIIINNNCLGARAPIVIKEMLDKGAEVNFKNDLGRTPLHLALIRRNICASIVKILLINGARIDTVDKFGSTPMIDLNFARGVSSSFSIDLMQHIIMMKTLNLDMQIDHSNTAFLGLFQQLCSQEVQRLKHEQFGNYSLCDVFCKYDNPTFVLNASLEKKINSLELESEFPIYGSFLKQTFKRAKNRIISLNSAEQFFSLITKPFHLNLPKEMKRNVLCLLNDEDLQNILEVCNS